MFDPSGFKLVGTYGHDQKLKNTRLRRARTDCLMAKVIGFASKSSGREVGEEKKGDRRKTTGPREKNSNIRNSGGSLASISLEETATPRSFLQSSW